MENKKYGSSLMIPAAIIIAGAFIAGAVVYSNNSSGGANSAAIGVSGKDTAPDAPRAAQNIKEVTSDDHIRGSKEALITIVEFSDLECPFCKRFHETMKQISKEYDGKVAWVYRHFPLDNLHSKARKEAEAAECAAELGGNDAFWAYIDRLFEITPSNNRLDQGKLPNIAEYIGLEREKFQECLDSGRYADHIEDNLQDAIASGGTGTPYSVLITSEDGKFVISGAQPFAVVKQIIDTALGK